MPGFWSRLTGLAKKSNNPDWGVLERYMGWAFGGRASASGIVVNATTAMQSAAVYSCIKVLSESVGQLPIYPYKIAADGTKQVDVTNPLYDLLVFQPNEWQTTVDFFEMMTAHLELRGNAYAYLNRTRSGQVLEMLPLMPDSVNCLMDGGFNLTYQVTGIDGAVQTVDPANIMHIRGMSLNGYQGISPISYARETIGLALSTEKFGSQLFRNGAKMGGVLEHPGILTDEAAKRLRNTFDDAHSGENSHRTALLEEGMKFTKISMSADDSQFLETRRYQRSEICGIFRVPPHKIADLEKATFSNIEEQNIQFVTDGLMPILNRIEKAIARVAIPKDQRRSLSLKFDVAELLRGNAGQRSAYYTSGINSGWLTRNEARAMEDMNALDGLDEPLVPLNMISADDLPDSDEAASAVAGMDDSETGKVTNEPA
jgi:HK97 family phage portal protein